MRWLGKHRVENIDVLFFQPMAWEGTCFLFSNALLQLASFLCQHGFKAKVVNLGVESHFEKTVRKSVKKYNPRYVCIGLRWYPHIYVASETARIVKSLNDKITTILGGHTAAFFDKEVLEACPSLDIVIRGDGELPLLNILKNGDRINCTYRSHNELVRNPVTYTQGKPDLKGLHLVNLNEIIDSFNKTYTRIRSEVPYPASPVFFVWCGKGCNYNCIYCGARHDLQKTLFNRNHAIFRDVHDVLNDIDEVSKAGFPQLEFDFDPFADDKSFYFDLFDKIENKRFYCTFHAWSLPPEELLESLNNTFRQTIVIYSPETFDESAREYLYKNHLGRPYTSNNEIVHFAEDAEKYENIYLELYLTAGLPLETAESFKKTLAFSETLMKKHPSVFARAESYTPIYYFPLRIEPGTFLDEKSAQLARRCDLEITRKTYSDFYEYSKREFSNQPRNIFGVDSSSAKKILRRMRQFDGLLSTYHYKTAMSSLLANHQRLLKF